MKVVFRGNDTADVSEIQSVSINTADKRIEVKLAEEMVRVFSISKTYFYNALPERIANELEQFSEVPDAPIEQVIDSRAWAVGCLQVKLDANGNTSARGLASLCWDWPWDKRPADEDLEFRTGLSAAEIKEVTSRDIYKQHVEDLMYEERDVEDYKKWVKNYGKNMPKRLGRRMRLPENTIIELVNSVDKKHGIDSSDLTDSSTPSHREKPERTIGSGKSSVYLYYYPQYRESAESKGEQVWECKIGLTIHSEADGRIRTQATGLPENPKIGLQINTDEHKRIERIIHDILKVRGKHIEDAPGREWFVTSPSEVEEIYNFVGENAGVGTSN